MTSHSQDKSGCLQLLAAAHTCNSTSTILVRAPAPGRSARPGSIGVISGIISLVSVVVGIHNADAAATAVQVNKEVVVLPLLCIVLVHVRTHTPLSARALRYELHLQQRKIPAYDQLQKTLEMLVKSLVIRGSFAPAMPLWVDQWRAQGGESLSWASEGVFPAGYWELPLQSALRRFLEKGRKGHPQMPAETGATSGMHQDWDGRSAVRACNSEQRREDCPRP